ncbi:MAG: hypothetical protein P8J55_05845 [Pseudomonadales bacterium]|nr:hypothetical protein [Pseudomonadales bacterium]
MTLMRATQAFIGGGFRIEVTQQRVINLPRENTDDQINSPTPQSHP